MASDLTGTISINRRRTNNFMARPNVPPAQGFSLGNPPAPYKKDENTVGQNLQLMKPKPAAANSMMAKAAMSK